MSRFFNIKFIGIVLTLVLLGELFALSQLYLDTHAETQRDARLVEQLLTEQAARLSQHPVSDWVSSLGIEKLNNLPNLRIYLIAEDGQVMASNQAGTDQGQGVMSVFAWILEQHVGLLSIMLPVMVDEQYVGEIVISQNVDYELGMVASQAIEILLPWFCLFVLTSFILAHLFSALLTIIDPLLTDKLGKRRNNLFAVIASLSCIRVPMRLLSSVFTLSQQFEQQKQKVVTAQEDERKRMAAELHDELGQHLTALRFELDSLNDYAAGEQFQQLVDTLQHRSQRMTEIFRSNLEQLRPPELVSHGLRRCLQQLLDDWQRHHPDSELRFDFDCHERLLGEQGQLVAYRVIQECLTNIRRYAGDAVSVSVRVFREGDRVMIEVNDNGQGCDLSVVTNGFGLIGMRERVDAVSGQLQIQSKPGQGMQVLAAIPIKVEM